MSFFGGRKSQPAPSATEFPQAPAATHPARQTAGFDTVLGPGATLKGDLKSQGNVRLDGTFEGTLEIDGNVLVGEAAKITADIHAKNVSIAGAVRGNVSGKKVQLLRSARVWGDISATSISTEEGAFIDGKIAMITHDAGQDFDTSALPLPDLPISEPPPPEPPAEDQPGEEKPAESDSSNAIA
jgi:cytoskeletal protein CcmA (bactofilin family)